MSGGLVVHGGADGIEAKIDDLLRASRFFTTAGRDVEEVLDSCRWLSITFAAATGSGDDVWGGLVADDTLQSAISTVAGIDAELAFLGKFLFAAAVGYGTADSSVLHEIGSGFTGLWKDTAQVGEAVIDSTPVLFGHGPVAAAQSFLTDDPHLVDGAADWLHLAELAPGTGLSLLKVLADAYFVDGRPSVAPLGVDRRMRATWAPRGLADLMSGLGLRDAGKPGEVDVKILVGTNGKRHVIVDIPGTKDWSLVHETTNVAGWATNVRAIDGAATTYEKGALKAMTEAGVRPGDDVMVVGHSLGGLVAVALARDAARSNRFNVTHVVTAGSPIAGFVGTLPHTVQVLALENKHDVVPHLDGADNPDRTNVTTVQFDSDTGTIGGDHGIDTSYTRGAAEADASDDPAIRAFLSGAAGYFDAGSVQTHAYLISRE